MGEISDIDVEIKEEVVLSDMPENIPDIPDIFTEIVEVPQRRKSIIERIKEKQNDQDYKQKTNVFITLMFLGAIGIMVY